MFLVFHSDDGSIKFFWNINNSLPDYTIHSDLYTGYIFIKANYI